MSEQFQPNWPLVRISDLAEINIGGTPSRAAQQFWATKPEGNPWIAISDLKDKYVDDTKEYITDLGARCSNVKLIEPFTTVMSFKLTVGRTAITTRPMYCNEAIAIFSPKNDALSAGWLYHALPRAALSVVTDNAVKGATLNKAKMAEMTVQLPPITEQREIAKVLDTLDTAIHETEALIDKLKAVKQGLLHDLLTRGIDANGQLRPPQSEAPQLYKESPLGWIPKEWECREFSALAEYLNGNTFDAAAWTDSGFPIIRIQNLNGSRDFNYYAGPIQEKWHVHPGDLLFAWSGQRGVSFGARLWDGPEGVLNQHIFKVLPKESLVSKAFLYRLLRFRQVNIEDAAHGFKDSFLHVTRGELGGVNAGVPPLDEQERIELRIAAYESKLLAEEAELGKLQSMKTGLMGDLLTGRVRVTPLLPD